MRKRLVGRGDRGLGVGREDRGGGGDYTLLDPDIFVAHDEQTKSWPGWLILVGGSVFIVAVVSVVAYLADKA